MEQYEIAPGTFLETLQEVLCLYKPKHVFIRQVGCEGGKTMVRMNLYDKKLVIKKTLGGTKIFVGGDEVFFLGNIQIRIYRKKLGVRIRT